MPRSKQAFEELRNQTLEKIERAALSLFSRYGLSVSISQIAKEAGISQGLLYHHYSSKDELIASLASKAMQISVDTMTQLANAPIPVKMKINALSEGMCAAFQGEKMGAENFMFMAHFWMQRANIKSAFDKDYTDALPILAEIVSAGQNEGSVAGGDPLLLATTYWAAIQGICTYLVLGVEMIPPPEMLSRILLKDEENCNE